MDTEEHVITKQDLLLLLATGKQLSDRESQMLLQLLRIGDGLTDEDRKEFLRYLASKDDLSDAELQELLASTKDPVNQKLLTSLITDPDDYVPRLLDKKYSGKLNRYVYGLTRNKQDTEDVYQEAMAKACRALSGPGYTAERIRELDLEDLLYKITYHQFCTFYRREKMRKTLEISLDKALEPSTDAEKGSSLLDLLADPREQLEIVVKMAETLGLMKRLPKDSEEALRLSCFDGLSYEEIAKKLHQPVHAIRSHINRARELLRGMFEERNNEDILELMERLPENPRKALQLRHYEGLSDQEIAEKLHRPVDAIRNDISRGRKLLRSMFEELKNQPLKKPLRTRRPLKKPLEEVN